MKTSVEAESLSKSNSLEQFFKMGLTRPLFVYFRSFHVTNITQILKLIKAYIVCLGFEPRAAG